MGGFHFNLNSCRKKQFLNGNSCKLATSGFVKVVMNQNWQNVSQIGSIMLVLKLTNGCKYYGFLICGIRVRLHYSFRNIDHNIRTLFRRLDIFIFIHWLSQLTIRATILRVHSKVIMRRKSPTFILFARYW